MMISSTNTNKTKSFTYDNKQQLTKLVDDTNTYLYIYDNMGISLKLKRIIQLFIQLVILMVSC